MGTHHSKQLDLDNKDDNYFNINIYENYTHEYKDISTNNNGDKRNELPKIYRPRAKTISQAYPSLAFWRMRHLSSINTISEDDKSDKSYMEYLPTHHNQKLLPTVFYWDPNIKSEEASFSFENGKTCSVNCDKGNSQYESEISKSPKFLMEISPKIKFSHAFKFPHPRKKGLLHHTSSERLPKNVYLIGSWDEWQSKFPLVYSDDQFSTIINIPEGAYEYHFLVDNSKAINEDMPVVQSFNGSKNNLIEVRKSDFQVFDALAEDLLCSQRRRSSSGRESADSSSGSNNIVPSRFLNYLDDTGYSSDIPSPYYIAQWDKMDRDNRGDDPHSPTNHPSNTYSSGPPILPQQLLQIILNRDVPYNLEPGLLPEPNHVMVNHLYALSIKDGVMVLSTTIRHNKKYVTTLIYKSVD